MVTWERKLKISSMSSREGRFFGSMSMALFCALFLSSCAGLSSDVNDQDIQGVDDSLSLGSSNITKYDDALYQLGLMLDAYGCDVSSVQVRAIDNRTASKKLPADVTQMTITALNKIGNHLQIIDYDQDQLGIDLAIGTHTMERLVPDLALRGAITEFDKKVEKERNLGLDASGSAAGYDIDADMSYDTSAEGITAAMDFQLLDYKTQTLIPGVQAANRINLFNTSKGGGMGLSFIGSGVNFDAKVKKSQGLHSSLRLLVELSIAEVVGRYSQVPYWRCIPNCPEDSMTIKKYRRALRGNPNQLQVKKMLATAYGKPIDPFSNQVSQQEVVAFDQLKQQLNLPLEVSEIDFITQLWLAVPIEQGAENMRNVYVLRQQAEAEAALQREKKARQHQQEQEAVRQKEAQKQKKRTTFKFGTQDSF